MNTDKQRWKLLELAAHLRACIKGQEHVIGRVAPVLQRGELGLAHHGRPKGSFLFVGPTGTGKTELTNAFTAFLFGGARPLRFDMSEYQNQASVEKLIGEKVGDIGLLGRALAKAEAAAAMITAEAARDNIGGGGGGNNISGGISAGNGGTLLFDEIEKAHPLVLDLFLQILDDASITLASGERKNLSGYYIVCTSNIGAAEAMRMQSAPFASIERTVLARVNQTLRPELVGRMTEKVVFARLPYAVQREICESMIAAELARLRGLGHQIEITPDDVETILRAGFHKTLGARPMRGAVERFLQDKVAAGLLRS